MYTIIYINNYKQINIYKYVYEVTHVQMNTPKPLDTFVCTNMRPTIPPVRLRPLSEYRLRFFRPIIQSRSFTYLSISVSNLYPPTYLFTHLPS